MWAQPASQAIPVSRVLQVNRVMWVQQEQLALPDLVQLVPRVLWAPPVPPEMLAPRV